MSDYFRLCRPASRQLLASDTDDHVNEYWNCPINTEHTGWRRTSELSLQLPHSKCEELLISSWTTDFDRVFHESVVSEFERRGISGYRLRPATVRFRNGTVSKEYWELVVTGWGGIARPESGIRVVEDCPNCHRRWYSPLQDSDKLVDWSQWSGEDFFVVWPLLAITLITPLVAEVLKDKKVRSYDLSSLKSLEDRYLPASFSLRGFGTTRLSSRMPEDVARKYGEPLGFEPSQY